MVLQQRRLLVPETSGDVLPFLLGEDDAVELAVDDVVVVKGTRVLGDDVQLAAEGAEGTAMDGMGVRGAEDVRPGGVDGVVDHVGGCVEEAAFPSVNDFAGGVYLDEIAGSDQGEGDAEGVDPEGGRVDGVAEGDVPGDAFVVAKFAEDAEGEGEAAFQIGALGVFVREGGWGGEFYHLRRSGLGVDFWFVRGGGGGLAGGTVEAFWGSGL